MKFTAPIPLSLYIHLPWCVRKCPYCDFNSHEARQNLPEDEYVTALLKDLEEQLPRIWGRRLTSIFFGGGTPSLFSPDAIEKILLGVNTLLNFGPDIEITLEANPGTVDEKRFAGFRKAGVNRLSIGIQSLENEKLKSLGRIHNREYALRAIDAAMNAGFKNFNLDFMHGLPNQTLDEALSDLRDGLKFQPPHLSWYQLTIEPNTVFHSKTPVLPAEDILWDIQEQGKNLLTENKLFQYEVSAYANSGHECAHNKNYWEFGDYLGLGAGAHSKITDVSQGIITRHWQTRQPKDYLDPDKKFTAKSEVISDADVIFEFMLNALRLTHGVPVTLFTERTGLAASMIESTLIAARKKKLLIDDVTLLCPTELGHRFLNNVIEMFLPGSLSSSP